MASFSRDAFAVASFAETAFDFDAAAVVATTAHGGGLAPTKKEWDLYLKRFHELQRERMALRSLERGIKAELREQLFPAPPPKTVRELPVKEIGNLVEKVEETRIKLIHEDNSAIRLRIAELLLDIRHRAKLAKKRRRKKRDEEAILALLN